jgi:hypothetical protein
MKKLILFFSVFIFSCNSNKVEIDSIQIMAYNYEPDYLTQQLIPKPIIYSFINASGKSMVLRRINPNDDEVIGYPSSIEQKLIEQINLDLKLKEEKDFTWRDSSIIEIYDGPIIRIKVSSTNGKEISFIFDDKNYDGNSRFYLYKNLYESIIVDYKTVLCSGKNLELLKLKQKDFVKYAHHKDSLLLPIPNIFPPPPSLDEVKFVKPN